MDFLKECFIAEGADGYALKTDSYTSVISSCLGLHLPLVRAYITLCTTVPSACK